MEKGKTGKQSMPNNFDFANYEEFKSNLSNVLVETSKLVKCTEEANGNEDKLKLYFAGPWFDPRSSELYDTCFEIVKSLSRISKYDVFFPREQINETPLEAFEKNVKEISKCDVVVALVSRKDVGTAWEIGMAYNANKKIVLLGYDETTFLSHTNVMLAFTGKCITLKEFPRFLVGEDHNIVIIKNEWEGIE